MTTSRIIILTLLNTILLVYVNAQTTGDIPLVVKQKVDSMILCRLDSSFFKNVTFDCKASLIHVNNSDHLVLNNCDLLNSKAPLRTSDYYVLKYKLHLQDNAIYEFEIRIDKNLKIKCKIELPDCRNTDICYIKVDSIMAIALARKSGLTQGLGIFTEGLIFDTDAERFQWRIKNVQQKNPDKGELIFIDAITGERILEKDRGWSSSAVH